MVSIMPGIDARAPERTLTSSGFAGSPSFAPCDFSTRARASRTVARSAASSRSERFAARSALQSSVDSVNAGRDGQPERGHLGEPGPLASQEVLPLRIALGVPFPKVKHCLRHDGLLFLGRDAAAGGAI